VEDTLEVAFNRPLRIAHLVRRCLLRLQFVQKEDVLLDCLADGQKFLEFLALLGRVFLGEKRGSPENARLGMDAGLILSKVRLVDDAERKGAPTAVLAVAFDLLRHVDAAGLEKDIASGALLSEGGFGAEELVEGDVGVGEELAAGSVIRALLFP
jgi:hypothetical protein